MSRLIDADALCKSLKETQDHAEEWLANAEDERITNRADATLATLCEVKLRIDGQPTIDAVPVVHGHWIKDISQMVYRCSLCNVALQDIGYGFSYCPECGAKMDEGVT